MKNKIDFMNIVEIFYFIAVLTISFDIFLVINIGGFNVRIAQICFLIPMAYFLINFFTNRKIIIPIGFKFLLIWIGFNIIFIPNTTLITRNVAYCIWLIYNALLIITTVNIFNDYEKIIRLMKWYISTFFSVAIFGLIQFIFSLLNLWRPLLQDWWVFNSKIIPRINGFSYEPSYFATYMLIGFVLVDYLRKNKSSLISSRILFCIFLLITLIMLLSSSRMGWVMMALWFTQYPVFFIINLFKGKILKNNFKFNFILFMVILIIIFILANYGFDNFKFLLAGLGIIEGYGDHSAGTRFRELNDTLHSFFESPVIGYSLGGVSSKIGQMRGFEVNTIELAKQNEGMSVFVEVLAASGIIGIVPFILFIFTIIYKPLKLSKKIHNYEKKILLSGLTLSLIFELLILQFNQNILRPYLWLHISILLSLFSTIRNEGKNGTEKHNR